MFVYGNLKKPVPRKLSRLYSNYLLFANNGTFCFCVGHQTSQNRKKKHAGLFFQDRLPSFDGSSSSSHIVSSVEEDIIIYKLPGEKLGLGLRFDGGSNSNETIRRLFVQCCAEGSPAARTKCTWPGGLKVGDEILYIFRKIRQEVDSRRMR